MTCPSGTWLFGGGGATHPPSEPEPEDDRKLSEHGKRKPFKSPASSIRARGRRSAPPGGMRFGTGQPTTTTVFALCSVGTPVHTVVARKDVIDHPAGPGSLQPGSDPFVILTATCKPGTTLLGGGVLADGDKPGPDGGVPQQGVHVRGSYPSNAKGLAVGRPGDGRVVVDRDRPVRRPADTRHGLACLRALRGIAPLLAGGARGFAGAGRLRAQRGGFPASPSPPRHRRPAEHRRHALARFPSGRRRRTDLDRMAARPRALPGPGARTSARAPAVRPTSTRSRARKPDAILGPMSLKSGGWGSQLSATAPTFYYARGQEATSWQAAVRAVAAPLGLTERADGVIAGLELRATAIREQVRGKTIGLFRIVAPQSFSTVDDYDPAATVFEQDLGLRNVHLRPQQYGNRCAARPSPPTGVLDGRALRRRPYRRAAGRCAPARDRLGKPVRPWPPSSRARTSAG